MPDSAARRNQIPSKISLPNVKGSPQENLIADIINSLTTATGRQRITRFTEALDFVPKADMDWAMGCGILEHMKWA